MTNEDRLAQALRELAAKWMRHADAMYFAAHANRVRECAAELVEALAAHERAQPDRNPDGCAYRYRCPDGGTVIRFNHGEAVNGSKPIETIPFYYGQPSAQPASVADDCVLVALHRPAEGYEDVHPELVAEDAIREGWCYDVLTAAAPQPQAKGGE